MHVSLFGLFRDTVYPLGFAYGTESCYGQSLRLSSLEQACSVSSRKYSRLTPDRSDLCVLSVVRSDAVVQNEASYLLFCDGVKSVAYIFFMFREYLCEMFLRFSLNGVHVVQSFLLFYSVDSFSHLIYSEFSYCSFDLFRNVVKLDILLFFSDFGNYVVYEVDDLLDLFMSEHDSVQDFHFRNFVCSRFYHHDGFLGSGNYQVHVALFSLLERRVDDQLAVNSSDHYRTCRTFPRNIRNRKSN